MSLNQYRKRKIIDSILTRAELLMKENNQRILNNETVICEKVISCYTTSEKF